MVTASCFYVLSFQTLYDPFFISFYNLFYTSLPVLAMGIFDQVWMSPVSHNASSPLACSFFALPSLFVAMAHHFASEHFKIKYDHENNFFYLKSYFNLLFSSAHIFVAHHYVC